MYENIIEDIKNSEENIEKYLINFILKSKLEDWHHYEYSKGKISIKAKKDCFSIKIYEESRFNDKEIFKLKLYFNKKITLNKEKRIERKKLREKYNQIFNYIYNFSKYNKLKKVEGVLPITEQERRKLKLDKIKKA
jgi:hypothetical protein